MALWRETGEPAFKDIASGMGLDMQKFESCYLSPTCDNRIEGMLQEGKDAKIYGTPTFFINGKALVGPQDYATFKALIDAELAKAK